MPFVADRKADNEILESLKRFDDNIILSFDCSEIYSPLNTHPDLQIHKVDKGIVFAEPNCADYYRKRLADFAEVRMGEQINGGTYTSHIAYNIARVGRNVICNTKYADRRILEFYKSNGYNLIHIRQGYSKCNICIISDNSVITEDRGIAKVMKDSGINCCLLEVGAVRLDGFDYGFIGGASGVGYGRVFFCGEIEKHPQFEVLRRFVKENSDLEIVSLKSGELCDYGSIIYI